MDGAEDAVPTIALELERLLPRNNRRHRLKKRRPGMAIVARIIGITFVAGILVTVLASLLASAPDIVRYLKIRGM